ncbi:MAG: methyl-accepting chemotaxis protein [Gammaproteobacteria bacterium]
MSWFTDLRIRAKLTLVSMLTTATALLLAGVAIIVYDNYTYQMRKTEEISAQAGILGASVTAALEFNDPKAAQDYLNTFEANSQITAAGVYTANGSLFASYSRSGIRPPPSPEAEGHRFEGNGFIGFWPVLQGQREVGTVYLRAGIKTLADRIASFGGIILLVMIGSLLISLPVGMRLQSVIANPAYARSLIEASLDPMLTIDPEGRITDANEAIIKVTGATRKELIGTVFSNYFTEPEKARTAFQQVFVKGFVADYPLTINHRDGSLTDVLYNNSVYKDERGNVLGVFAAARDVTAQKQAEEALRKAHAELEIRVQERTADLERLVQQVREGIKVLGSGTSEILVATNQVASSSLETATSVNQTMATVEEVKQTVQVASQKAGHVLESARKLGQVSQNGKTSVEATIEGMRRIREQMEYIGESIMRLSDQIQAIGEIVAAVNDLSDQSNLLAVNAAIEAAKAGEQGKGFSVVAQEIKSLATQSKEATAQVRTILSDIQKATGTAVLATENGAKAVEAGVKQSAQAGESIRLLADSIVEAAQAATQIAASNQQQLMGMDQVAMAMENIKQASSQNVASTKQTETEAQKLHELGMKLKRLVEQD